MLAAIRASTPTASGHRLYVLYDTYSAKTYFNDVRRLRDLERDFLDSPGREVGPIRARPEGG